MPGADYRMRYVFAERHRAVRNDDHARPAGAL